MVRGTVSAHALDVAESLLESLPHTPFFVKDHALRYVKANSAMLDLCLAASKTEVYGKTARDFFPEPVRARHEAFDRQVMRTAKPVKDQLDLCVRANGSSVWFMSGRWPVVDAAGEIVGVVGVGRVLEAERREPTYERLSIALDYLYENFAAPFDIALMADRAQVSASQLRRDFISVFGMPPRRYL